MFIILMGAPGCGKGTQSAKLTEFLDIPHLSTGEMFRQMIQSDSPLGRRLADCVNQGKLVSDELVMELLAERLLQPDCGQGCLLDGVPRNVQQAKSLDGLLAAAGCSVDAAVEMQVPEEELLRRLMQRAKREGRSDDNAETIRSRMQIYQQETSPIVEHYRSQSKLQSINAVGSVEAVFDRVKSVLADL